MLTKLLKRAKSNELVNTSFYTGIATAIGFISGFVVNKVIAVVIGPTGVALISQFQNFINITTSISTGGIQQGVVKYVAEKRQDEPELSILISTSIKITFAGTLLTGIIILLFSKTISNILFGTFEYQYILVLFSISVILFGFNRLILSILNGLGDIKKLVLVKISNNIFGLLVTSVCAFYYGLSGALIALSISQSIVFFISLFLVSGHKEINSQIIRHKFSKIYGSKLFKYFLMALSSMVLPPLVQIGIRNHIIEVLSISSAGYWDGMVNISNAYLGLVSMTLSIYYLPKLSELTNRCEIKKEIVNGYKVITPVLAVAIFLIYFNRSQIINLLYTAEFSDMEDLFSLQLLGDFLKIMSQILGYLLLAKAKANLFIITQLFFSLFTYLLSIELINVSGLNGVVAAHAIKYGLHLITMIWIVKYFILNTKVVK